MQPQLVPQVLQDLLERKENADLLESAVFREIRDQLVLLDLLVFRE